MSEITNILAQVIDDRAPWTTDPVTNLTTGKVFTAEIDGSPDPLIVATELGEDARNVVILHVSDDAAAYAISKGDRVQFTLFGETVVCQVLKRRDSVGQPQTDFWAQQLTAKDK